MMPNYVTGCIETLSENIMNLLTNRGSGGDDITPAQRASTVGMRALPAVNRSRKMKMKKEI